jgi:branched-chain amino acid transport system permease protein
VAAIVVMLFAFGLKRALVSGIINGAVYGFVALGIVLIYKSSGAFNFAQGEFGTVGVYILYLLLFRMPYIPALLLALATAVAFGLLVERVVIRPLFDAPRVTLLVATAGVSLLAIGTEIWFGEAKLRKVDALLPRLDRLSILGVEVSDQKALIVIVLVALALGLGYFFNRTNLGLAILAGSQEPTATELVGISVKRLSAFTWGLAALLGGLAGTLFAPIASFTPGFLTSGGLIPGFTAAVIGGMSSLPGAFVGGAIVGVAQNVAVSASIFEPIPGRGSAIVFFLLIAILAVRPQGLLGK